MLYQKLLIGSKPYFVSCGNAAAFEVHRHPEIEISFCLAGGYDIICENKRCSLTEGDFLVIPSLAAHEIPQSNNAFCKSMTIELGYAFLGEYFESFISRIRSGHVYKKRELYHTSFYQEISLMMEETANLCQSYSAFRELSVKGNLYKISALLLQGLSSAQEVEAPGKKLTDIKKIDKALETIYNRYHEPLTVEEVSASCGYSKSNFCKIFKSITGYTFHNTLNRHRIEIACVLLRETDHTIEKIAAETGFSDAKSFCRVFKQHMGKSAGEYRKSLKRDVKIV